jgi:hypothetical protein
MRARAPRLRHATLALLAFGLGGCASLAPTLTPPASAPAPTPVPAAATAPGAPAALPADTARVTRADTTARINGFVPADSLPSPEAQRVLGTLPEPVPAAERAPGPADSTAIPTPSPTQPLGDKPGSLELMLTPDSTLTLPPPPRASAADSARTHASSGSGPCYKLQVGAPSESAKAAQLRLAATSQLELEFDILKIRGLYKVRSRDCLSRGSVDRLRERALAAGFHGVFAVAENKK